MISTSYPRSETDWRGRFIKDLVESLARRDDINLRLWAPPGPIPSNVEYVATSAEAEWLDALARKGGIAQAIRAGLVASSAAISGLLWRLARVYRRHRDVDIAHVNWLQNALPLIGTRMPALVSVLGTDYKLLSNAVSRLPIHLGLCGRPSVLAPNADWMCSRLQQLFGARSRVCAVPFGVDHRYFEVAREPLAQQRRIWLVVLRVTARKIGPLFEWTKTAALHGDEIHLFGPKQEPLTIPECIHYHGPTHPDELLDEWYPRAAGLITLSQHDEGRPQILLEAMAAGLPIIASKIPAHADTIEHGATGMFASTPQQFTEALAELSDPIRNRAVGVAAREMIRKKIGTWDDCAARYGELYRDLIVATHR